MSLREQLPIELEATSVTLNYVMGDIEIVVESPELEDEIIAVDEPDMIYEHLLDENVIKINP